MRVAVVGTGRMGSAMARRIAAAGHELTLYNRTWSTAQKLADEGGATTAPTARAAVESADVVVVSLADDAAAAATYDGEDGIVAGLAPGTVVCDTSTVTPEVPRQLAARASERGATLVDTPVSGGVPLADRGELTVLAGADDDTLAKARPVLQTFASTVFALGEVGAGAVMKLVVNSAVHALNVALSEALVLAERAGVDRATTYAVLESSAVAAPYVKYKHDAFLDPDNAPLVFSLRLVAKDYDLIASLAESVGAAMPQADASRALIAAAISDSGLGDADMAAVADHLRRLG
jgi:3-hydroxyisobutyrate dehydrogenase-like beta-hydroxyacid dehydrogenase